MIRMPLLILSIFCLTLFSDADAEVSRATTGVYSIPATEMRDVVTGWLQHQGFQLSTVKMLEEGYSLACSKGGAGYQVDIRQHSPLASTTEISASGRDADTSSIVSGLKLFLAEYISNLGQMKHDAATKRNNPVKVPQSVLLQEKAVFCLNASIGGQPVNFSGFVVNREGLIVSTAHDLEGIEEIIVQLGSGEKIPGKVIRRDPLRDLTLIKMEKKISAAVSVEKGRRKLNLGEKVFSIVCPSNSHGRLLRGVVDQPPAIVAGQPLWQVNMDVSPGESGGAVFDANGKLVGVVKGRLRGGWSRGFLIPVTTLREFLGMEGR